MKNFFFLFLVFISQSLLANECDYHFNLQNATIELLDTAQVVQQNFAVYRGQGSPAGRCSNYRVFFSKGLGNSYVRKAFTLWGWSLPYNLHKTVNQSGVLKDINDAVTANEFVDGLAPERNTTHSNRFFVSAPALDGEVIRAGTYGDIVQVTIYGFNESSGKYLFEETENLTVLFLVPKKVQVSLVDEGGIFNSNSTSKVMDFGILAQNQEKGADLRVLSNGSYQVRLSSINGGKLKLASGDTITYSLRVNGSNVSLASGTPVQIGSGDMTDEAGDLYNLKVKITENPSSKSAGMYQDVITITAIAN